MTPFQGSITPSGPASFVLGLRGPLRWHGMTAQAVSVTHPGPRPLGPLFIGLGAAGRDEPLAGVAFGHPGASWRAVGLSWTGRKGFPALGATEPKRRAGHPEGRSAAEDGGAVDLADCGGYPVRLRVVRRSRKSTGDSLYVLAGYVLLDLIYLCVVVLDRRIWAFVVVLDRRMRAFCRGVRPLKNPRNHSVVWKTPRGSGRSCIRHATRPRRARHSSEWQSC